MKQLICASLIFLSAYAHGQDSISTKELNEVIVTATRTDRKLGNTAVPVKVISQKTIQQSGSLRLNNILQEQTGLFITNSFGDGVQLQGMNPDYVMILLDGQPLVGRNGGVLDLSRIALGNVKKIEIVRGPSSSLYGSEAMGGVINIITEQDVKRKISGNLRYGSYNTTDIGILGDWNYRKFKVNAYLNRNSSDGYDFNPNQIGKTSQAYQNYTGQIKMQQDISMKIKLGITLRSFYERQKDLYSAGPEIVAGNPEIHEYNVSPFANFKCKNLKIAVRGYFSQFQSEAKDFVQRNDSLYYFDFFQQRFQRIENQTDWKVLPSNDLTIGGGYTWERLNTSRYQGIRSNTIGYFFLQDEQRAGNFTVIAGIRYVHNDAYASRWSPKLALHFKANDKFRINASYGAGFKAPDYRQLYLNFTNNLAGGYTVYGANEISLQQLEEQKQQGSIVSITPFGYQLKLLSPEYSTGANLGGSYRFSSKLFGQLNFFRNDINNLIITKIIAIKSNNAPVFSYFNINKAFTQGLETELTWKFNKVLRIEGGYQYLETADKAVLKKIKLGEIANVGRSDYGGLTGRSKHMANLKLLYENKNWFGTLRSIYRSRWGVTDKDGNQVLNRDDEYAKGFVQLNLSAGKNFKNGIRLMAGIDNLLNYRDKTYLTNQAGITYYIGAGYSFKNR